VPDKAEIADFAALTERLGADEIGVREIPVVNDIRMAAHGAELHDISLPEDLSVNALVAFKVEFVFRVVFIPGIAPAGAGALFEPEGHDFLHQRQKEGIAGHLRQNFRNAKNTRNINGSRCL